MEIALLLKILGFAGAIVAVYVRLNTKLTKVEAKVETNSTRLDKAEAEVKEVKSDRNAVQESINSLKLEMIKQFSEIKLELKDKADRDDKK